MQPVAASKIVAAILLALTTTFQDGLKKLEGKDYDGAVKAFTEVVDADHPGNIFRDAARLFRARAHHGAGRDEEALKDLVVVVVSGHDAALRADAERDFRDWGGDPARLQPELSPRAVWQAFIKAARTDKAQAITHCAGDWRQRIEQMSPAALQQFAGETADCKIVDERCDAGKTAAWLSIESRGQVVNFALQQEDGHWRLATMIRPQAQQLYEEELDIPAKNLANLQAVGRALMVYARRFGAWPAKLEALVSAQLVPAGPVLLWVHPQTGRASSFLHRADLPLDDIGDEDRLLAAAPEARDGRRLVLYANGRVDYLPEARFAQLARSQNWAVQALRLHGTRQLTAEQRQRFEALIEQLGAVAFKERMAALAALREAGAEALPLLEAHRDHADPEVRGNVRMILREQGWK